MQLAEILAELEGELRILSTKLSKISDQINAIKCFCKENNIDLSLPRGLSSAEIPQNTQGVESQIKPKRNC